ncbi:MAG: pilin [bacterium]|nr:pilin [bacterium]
MKKVFLLIIFIGALVFVASNALAAPLPPDSQTCSTKFADRSGETRSANSWCTGIPDGPYDFCVGDRHYQFSCKGGGLLGSASNCDPTRTSLETCTDSCTNWDCAAGSGCQWGSCEQASLTPPAPGETPTPSGPTPPAPGASRQGDTSQLNPPINAKSFEELINGIINFVFWIGVAVAPIMILIAGVMYMTAGGDTIKLGKAKSLILYTVIGFTIIMFARGLIALLESILGK